MQNEGDDDETTDGRRWPTVGDLVNKEIDVGASDDLFFLLSLSASRHTL
jgi:hypothetical protein